MRALMLVCVLGAVGCYASWQDKYDLWAADLPAGYMIVTDYSYQPGQKCYCKVPDNSTTTTTSSTTTTTTTSTTTTTTTTTTTVPGAVPPCDADITISSGSVDYWETPYYPNDYPENMLCTITITVPASIFMGIVNVVVEGPAEIHSANSGCVDVLTDPNGGKTCSGIEGKMFSYTSFVNPHTYTFTFSTSSSDGGAAKGMRLRIEGIDMMG